VRRQQQVLHGREDRRVHRLGEAEAGVAAHDDQHRCGGDAAHRPPVDVAQEGRGEAFLLERPGPALPEARREPADDGAQRGVAHHDEDEGLAVLGARRVGGGREDAGDRLVVHVVGEERAGGPLGEHHLEEVRHAGPRPPMVASTVRRRRGTGLGGVGATRYFWRSIGRGRCPP